MRWTSLTAPPQVQLWLVAGLSRAARTLLSGSTSSPSPHSHYPPSSPPTTTSVLPLLHGNWDLHAALHDHVQGWREENGQAWSEWLMSLSAQQVHNWEQWTTCLNLWALGAPLGGLKFTPGSLSGL
ncbi:uncharacterized protein BXZ73DRAFT_83661 [Epithele typhae]|uniref:uncharacterized protein n=1 Tax=Epithele typhae TaxID=378194 RepID=UPI002007DB3A|nr:uncharacterized protein BXZ73DRAFT_83661 [Epithele typhae]KAH9910379.1 hypothetical protein BXZ73DRAFT_83661 [Epithele typhae]